jgi:hypothetical protein
MRLDEFLSHIEPLAAVAEASEDPDVQKAAAVLHTLKGSLLAGGPILESFFDQMATMNTNLRDTVLAMKQG